MFTQTKIREIILVMEELFLNTKDNVKIALNWYNTSHKSVIVICPGWFMTKDSKAFSFLAEKFSEKLDVIVMDFRGHGRSKGFYTFTSKELFDLETVVDFAKKHYEKVFLIGFSLGGGLVIHHSAKNNNVNKIIAVSPPADFYKIENCMWHPNAWIPTFKKFEPKRWVSVRPSLVIHKKKKPLDVVEKITVPTLFVAGRRDVTVRPWHTELLYQKAVCKKKLEIFENGIHAEDLFLDEPERFVKMCLDWVEQG